jgi:hypothetical protein
MNQPSSDGSHTTQLFLAWAWVGIPLLWGVWLTLNNALKLFQPPA